MDWLADGMCFFCLGSIGGVSMERVGMDWAFSLLGIFLFRLSIRLFEELEMLCDWERRMRSCECSGMGRKRR